MNKLGFYVENTTVAFLRDALREVKPPAILVHAGDRGLMREIRRELSPDSFIVGRYFVPLSEQEAWINGPDPEARGRALAESILGYDFGYATERGSNGRLLIDAWMALNEPVRGPASFATGVLDHEAAMRADALDRFQVAFREKLQTQGLEAVAFTFAAGNYTQPGHYIDHYPRTLVSYRYLGFHEYGWPSLMPRNGTATSALFYRRCMAGIRQRFGDRHRAIITEVGLARMYKYPHDAAGDVGWLYPGETISQEQYWDSLRWYNDELSKDAYVIGCCLFQVGHSGRWETFRLLGQDYHGRTLSIINRIASLRTEPPPSAPPSPPIEDEQAELRRRLAAAEKLLGLAAQSAARLLELIAQIRQALQGLALAMELVPDRVALRFLALQLDRIDVALNQSGAPASSADTARLRDRLTALRLQVASLGSDLDKAISLASRVTEAQTQFATLARREGQVKALRETSDKMLAEVRQLCEQLGPEPSRAPVPAEPEIRDRTSVAAGVEGKLLQKRNPSDIKRIIVHHTNAPVSASSTSVVRAEDIGRNTRFHFVVDSDGVIDRIHPIETVLAQTDVVSLNLDSIGVALVGTFKVSVPTDTQLQSAAKLIAWLLHLRGLHQEAVSGRCELDPSVASPGVQWLQGAQFKLTLIDAVARELGATRDEPSGMAAASISGARDQSLAI